MKNIIVTGNTEYGLSSEISKFFDYENLRFCSRSNGYDFTDEEKINFFATESLQYDIFINCSALHNFLQTKLLKKVSDLWYENNKKGKIINIGSTADRHLYNNNWLYPQEKKTLREYSSQLSNKFKSDGIVNVSYISLPTLDIPKMREKHPNRQKLDCKKVCEVIDFIIKQPYNIVINEISIDVSQT